MMRRSHRSLYRFATSIGLPVALGLVIGVLALQLQSIAADGVALAGLRDSVTIVRDQQGVPHIYASNDHDALFSIGYLHARDRLWQMEQQRRLGRGRLGEILGLGVLETDRLMRNLGLDRAARETLEQLDEVTRLSLDAYVAGVNAWLLEGHSLPDEFQILGYRPEPWTHADSLLLARLAALNPGAARPQPGPGDNGPPAQSSSAWYPAAIHGQRLQVSGATLPGLPCVIDGVGSWVAGLQPRHPEPVQRPTQARHRPQPVIAVWAVWTVVKSPRGDARIPEVAAATAPPGRVSVPSML